MIKICRIDHRLLHGQVAFVWCRSLNADAILIVSDAVAKDEMRMATMRLAKPAGVKLVIKSVEDSIKVINSGVTDKYKLMVVVENVQDAYDLKALPTICSHCRPHRTPYPAFFGFLQSCFLQDSHS